MDLKDSKSNRLPISTGQSLENISRLLGINPCSCWSKLCSLAIAITYCFLSQMSWRYVCIGYCEDHLVRRFMVTLQYILYTLLILMTMSTSLVYPKQFAFPHREMSVIDTILESYGARFSDKDIFFAKYLQDVATATMALLAAMIYLYDIIVNDSYQLIWFSMRSWYTIVFLLIIDGLFAHYMTDVYLRYRELNKIAVQRFDKSHNIIISKIRSFRYIHHRLYVLAKKMNTNFGQQLLIVSGICLNAIILFLHDMYYNMKKNNVITEKIIFQAIFILCYIFRSLYISHVCQRTRNESRRMTRILHNTYVKYRLLRSEVVHFSLQLIHENLVFTAFGLYEIDIPLMCSITGAVMTYLVMVVQLDVSEKFANINVILDYAENNCTRV